MLCVAQQRIRPPPNISRRHVTALCSPLRGITGNDTVVAGKSSGLAESSASTLNRRTWTAQLDRDSPTLWV
eukprot:scaffold117006_cov71-Phaeocystis_antarctica.AAC.6